MRLQPPAVPRRGLVRCSPLAVPPPLWADDVAASNVYLKLESLQPRGSFKSRGIDNLMTRAAAHAPGPVHFYCVPGGNAGLACAT